MHIFHELEITIFILQYQHMSEIKYYNNQRMF